MARPLAAATEVERHLAWLRNAVADPKINIRLVLAGILDVLDALADRPPRPGGPE